MGFFSVMVYGLRCSILPLDWDARVFLRIFSLMSFRFKIPRQLLSGNFLSFVIGYGSGACI